MTIRGRVVHVVIVVAVVAVGVVRTIRFGILVSMVIIIGVTIGKVTTTITIPRPWLSTTPATPTAPAATPGGAKPPATPASRPTTTPTNGLATPISPTADATPTAATGQLIMHTGASTSKPQATPTATGAIPPAANAKISMEETTAGPA